MAHFALLVEMKAKPGKEAEIEPFLAKEASLVRNEPGTLSWHAARVEGETGAYRVFDTFDTETAREAHLNGEAGREFIEKAGELFTEAKISRLTIVAQK